MDVQKVESLFKQFDEAAVLLQKETDVSYVEALVETVENLSYDGVAQQVDGKPSDPVIRDLNKRYKKMEISNQSATDLRKVIQFCFVKAIREDHIQANHQMTPDAIAYLVALFLQNLLKNESKSVHIHDLAVGTGNLLYVVMEQLGKQGVQTTAEAVDNDDLLLSLAANVAQLLTLGSSVSFTHSDSLQDLLIKPADVAVSDVPVGYYPMEERAKKFQTAFANEPSYAHYLLIEQHMNYLRDGGWGVFVVPKNMFDGKGASNFVSWIKEVGYLQGLMHLPESLFRNQAAAKSILLLQKAGGTAKQAEPVLLGTIPSLKDARKMKEFSKEFNHWANLVV